MGRRASSPRRAVWLAAAVLVLLGLAVYANSFRGVFVLDDHHAIVRNDRIHRLWPIGPVLRGPRPVVSLSLAVNYALGGCEVWGYHAFNLAVHLLAGLALLGVIRRTLLGRRLRDRFGQSALPLAAVCAALWLVHPLQTAAVTYIVQRAEAMMGLFYLLTLYCAIRGFTAAPAPRRLWFAAAVLCSALGMGCKEVMVTAPLMVLLYDRLFVGRSFREIFRDRWGLYAALGGTWTVLLVRLLALPRPTSAGPGTAVWTPWSYALTQLGVIAHYLRLAVLPTGLCLDYAWRPAEGLGAVMPEGLLVVALLAATVVGLWRWPAAGFLGAWFFLILAPSSSIMPIADAAFEHRMYLPLAAVVVLGVLCGWKLAGRLGRLGRALPALVRTTAVVAVALALSVLTVRRNRLYADELAMYRDVVRKAPHNPRGHRNLGVALVERGRLEEALGHFELAVRLLPACPYTRNNYAAALERAGRIEQAIVQYNKALQLKADFPDALGNLGALYGELGRYDLALEYLQKALKLAPADPGLYFSTGIVLARAGRPGKAIAFFREAIRLDADFPNAYYSLATALAETGRWRESAEAYRRQLRLQPGHLFALNGLARLLATCPDPAVRDGREAVRLAERACRAAGGEERPAFLDTLAAAYAEAGRFDDAVRTVELAMARGRIGSQGGWQERWRQRLALYRAGRPLRQPVRR